LAVGLCEEKGAFELPVLALARGDLPAEHAVQLSLQQIRTASHRARALVQQILTFSRRQLNLLQVQRLQPVMAGGAGIAALSSAAAAG
jgi:signal transduction histidine kinase